jgi:hypothetical protein
MPTDNFNRAGPGLGGNWTQTTSENTLVIASNHIEFGSAGSDAGNLYTGSAFANDQYSQLTLPVIATAGGGVGTGIGVGVREANGARTYYRVVCCAAGTELGKVVSGSFTSLGTDSTAWADGDIVRLEVSGTSITVKRNGATIGGLTTTDGDIGSGSASMKYSSAASGTPTADDWDGGDITAGSSSVSPSVSPSSSVSPSPSLSTPAFTIIGRTVLDYGTD